MKVPSITVFGLFILTFGYTASKVEARYTRQGISPDVRKQRLAANCMEGQILNVDCNRCLCVRRGTLACTEKKCLNEPKFSVAEQNRLINKIGEICSVGDVIETNCKTCNCRSPGNLQCTNVKRKCITKPGITINMKKFDNEDEKIIMKESFKLKYGNPDEGQDRPKTRPNEADYFNRPDQKAEDDGPGGNQGFEKPSNKHLAALTSYVKIKALAKNCKRTEVIETVSHLCKCMMAGVVDCILKKGYEEFEKNFSIKKKPARKIT